MIQYKVFVNSVRELSIVQVKLKSNAVFMHLQMTSISKLFSVEKIKSLICVRLHEKEQIYKNIVWPHFSSCVKIFTTLPYNYSPVTNSIAHDYQRYMQGTNQLLTKLPGKSAQMFRTCLTANSFGVSFNVLFSVYTFHFFTAALMFVKLQ